MSSFSAVQRAHQFALRVAIVLGLVLASGASASAEKLRISSAEAHTKYSSGQIDLVDIRRPSEWRRSGVAVGAATISMHQGFSKFLSKMKARAAANGGRPIAIICAAGVRTHRMQDRLARHGIKVINVADGMFGKRRHGPGWLRAGLPVQKWSPKPRQQ